MRGKQYFKGCTRFFRKRPEEVKTCERHIFVLNNKDKYSVIAMCRVLKISESGYYRWLKNRNKPTARKLLSDITEIQCSDGKLYLSAVLDCYNGEILSIALSKQTLKETGLVQSLSGTGHCFDNARMESFFATLKKEKIYRISAYKLTQKEVKSIIFRYIFAYYNRIRISSVNSGGMAPVTYREWAKSKESSAA